MSDWPTREEILGGLPARRAWTLLFLIESHASRRVALLREAGGELASEHSLAERESADLEAYALGREPAVRPSIQELEQTADVWASLVPRNPRQRAAVAKLIGDRHRFTAAAVPRLRAALGLDEPEVREAFLRQEGTGIEAIYAPRLSPWDRLRFAFAAPAAWLERAEPRRATAALTFGIGISQPLLALPLVLAAAGPALGLAIVAGLGICSVLATAAMAEAVTRSADVRHRGAFFGRLVTGLLGSSSGAVPVGLTVVRAVLSMLAAFVGLATTLAADTVVPSWVWAVLALAVVLWTSLLNKRSASLAALMLLGIGSTVALLGLATASVIDAAASGSLQTGSFTDIGDGDAAAFAALVGVTLMTLVNPLYTVQFARVLLPGNAEGARFIQGSVIGASGLVAVALVFGALITLGMPAGTLAAERSTVLVPLGDQLGSVAVLLALPILVALVGLTLNRNAAALIDLTEEALPRSHTNTAVLPRRHGELVLQPPRASHPRVRIVYRGLEAGAPALGVSVEGAGGASARRVVLEGPWSLDEPAVEVRALEAGEEHIRLELTSALRVTSHRNLESLGGGALDTLLEAGDESAVMAWLGRRGEATLPELAERLELDPTEARAQAERLQGSGRLRLHDNGGDVVVRPEYGARRARQAPPDVWEKLGVTEPSEERPEGVVMRTIRDLLADATFRRFAGVVPVVGTFLVALALLLGDDISFAQPLQIAGVISGLTLALMLPVILLAAARRSSELSPGEPTPIIGSGAAQAVAAAVGFAILLAHGLVLWDAPGERIAAIAAALAVVAISAGAVRSGAFRPSLVLQLHTAADGRLSFTALNGSGPPFTVGSSTLPPGGAIEGEVESNGLLLSGAGPCPRVKVWSLASEVPGGRPAVRVVLRQAGDVAAEASLLVGGEEVAMPAGPGPWELEVIPPEEEIPARRRGARSGGVSLEGL